MSLQSIPLHSVTETDLTRLVQDATRESRVIEYKRIWRLEEPDRREFLADIASFANANGGDIIYGVEAKDGVPIEVLGLEKFVQDAEQLKVSELLNKWINPRLAGVDYASVALKSGKVVFVIRVPRSLTAPHMVTYNGVDRFVSRGAAGKSAMDVNQLREAFTYGDKLSAKLRDFRLDRINRISMRTGEVQLEGTHAIVLHIQPVAPLAAFDVIKVSDIASKHFGPMGNPRSFGTQITFDGVARVSSNDDGVAMTYVQIFRDGSVEAAVNARGEAKKMISPGHEDMIRSSLKLFLPGMTALGLTPPFIVGVSYVNVEGFMIWESAEQTFFNSVVMQPLKRPNLAIPDVLLEQTDDASIDKALKQIFDQLWNACGRYGSPNFTAEGVWKVPSR